MPENIFSLKSLIVFAGAGITMASTAITGLRIHRAMLRHLPWLATLVPRDGGVVVGFAIGATMVALWFGNPFG